MWTSQKISEHIENNNNHYQKGYDQCMQDIFNDLDEIFKNSNNDESKIITNICMKYYYPKFKPIDIEIKLDFKI